MSVFFGILAAANAVIVINGAAHGEFRVWSLLALIACGAAAWKWRK